MTTGMINIRVDVGADKMSYRTRIDRAELVGKMATITPLYQTNAPFKDSIDKLVQAGVNLSAAEAQVLQLEAAIIKARSTRDVQRNAYDKAHGICISNVEGHSAKPEDTQSYGFAVLAKNAQPLAPPSDIQIRYDPAKGVIRVHVLYTSGKHRCVIEISPDPAGVSTFKRVDGDGIRRTLAGYAPGTWWVRAATLRSKEHSDWFGPVAVIVK